MEPLELVVGALGGQAPRALRALQGGWAPDTGRLLEGVAAASAATLSRL